MFENCELYRSAMFENCEYVAATANQLILRILIQLNRLCGRNEYTKVWLHTRRKYGFIGPRPTRQRTESLIRLPLAKNEIGGARFYNGPTPAERHFCALKRILDREEADYAS